MKPGESLPVGHMLDGRYRIHKVLGQGGMGRVYLANDTRLANRPVACKEMIVGDGLQEQKAIEDFNREARVLASLSHPSIPQIIDYFSELGCHYLVMEFVAGGDLQSHLDKLGPHARMPEGRVLTWARQILEVLSFLHAQSPPIVYRDLKPGNIMIDQHGRAMLIDFGIARFLPAGGRGTQIGSIGYAPPEQYMGKMEPRSDLFSLAATMHHLLTGRDPQLEPPFSFPPVHELAPEVSSATEHAVMHALEKDVSKRPASARAMRDELPPPIDEPQPVVGRAEKQAAPGQMDTIVLNRPMVPSNSAISSAPIARGSPAPQLPLTSPPPAEPAPQSQSGARQRPASVPKPQASSTAPTRDLKAQIASPASMPAAPHAPPGQARPPTGADVKASGRALERLATALGSAAKIAGALGVSSAKAAGALSAAMRAPSEASSTAKTGPLSSKSASAASSRSRAFIDPALAVRNSSGKVGPQRADPAVGSSASNGYRAVEPVAAAWLIALDGVQFGVMGRRVIVGRATSAEDHVDIDLAPLKQGNDRISRRHAEIISQGGEYYIRDLGSLNGTYIAGRGRLGRDQLYKLKDRDEIILGATKLQFRRG
jgi:serine/threonine protein kinase